MHDGGDVDYSDFRVGFFGSRFHEGEQGLGEHEGAYMAVNSVRFEHRLSDRETHLIIIEPETAEETLARLPGYNRKVYVPSTLCSHAPVIQAALFTATFM